MTPHLRIIPLGGLGEIGKNMMAVECGDDIVIIDCGVQFPEENMPGVDLIIPDIAYLLERKERVRAILITHGHEDHIGALPFVLPQLNVPVYASRLTHGLISVKLKNRQVFRDATLKIIEPRVPYEIAPNMRASWFRVCHSIPDSMGLAIETAAGTIIHTGDFKIDHTPVDGHTIDLATLARHGSQGVLLMMSDSTYAEVPGYTLSEKIVGEALDRAIRDAPGRVLVASFASLVSRIQQVIDAAKKYDRKVSLVGRSMIDNVQVAAETGYLNLPQGMLLPVSQARLLPPEKVVLMTTGSQGEPTSALVRIANRDHRDIQIMKGDTVIISASPIPGNELAVSRTIDNLFRQGARVLYDRVALVHVHGHASQEELKMMLSLVRPRYFVPVHGEYRHLMAHAQLAWDQGVAESGIFVLEDGDILEITENSAQVVDKVPNRTMFIDGVTPRDYRSRVLTQRRDLSKNGMVVIVLLTEKETGISSAPAKLISSGFMDGQETEGLYLGISEEIKKILHDDPYQSSQPELTHAKVRETARNIIANATGQRPMIIPVVLEV